ncbi:acyltransferase [Bacillus canaveralius]|uniref:Acyltransferase n=2 Tax=Bacillaceae TaxID=186817 RepID=A0A2N5GRG0_9BACI|nr:acyltransferase [Bacillus sp. V33-4]PLR86014.1 acyltransferase [Bacillus canaveralius]PLS00133.1 acyltransferase [Bacillus canaveralius]
MRVEFENKGGRTSMSAESRRPSKEGKKYIYEIHFLRAFACLSVVGVHVSATNYGMTQETWTWFTYFLNQIGRFGTPIFAVISGFLLFYQVKRRGFALGRFLKTRLSKIIIPFLIWSLAYRYLLYYYDNQALGDYGAEVKKILLGDSFYHLYFVAIVVQFYLIFPFIQKLFRTQTLLLVFAFIALLISYNLYGFSPGIEGAIGEFLASKSFMPIWIFYFAFGGFLAYFWDEIVNFATKRPWQMLALALIVSAGAVVEYMVNGFVSNRRLSNLANIPLLCIATIGIYPLLARWNVIKKPLYLIGQYSMGIYLIHPMILYLFARHLPEHYWNANYVVFMFIAVMIIAVVFIRVLQFIPLSGFIIPVPKIKKTKSLHQTAEGVAEKKQSA